MKIKWLLVLLLIVSPATAQQGPTYVKDSLTAPSAGDDCGNWPSGFIVRETGRTLVCDLSTEKFIDISFTAIASIDDWITPDDLYSQEQTDEYCLTFEAGPPVAWEWQPCGIGEGGTTGCGVGYDCEFDLDDTITAVPIQLSELTNSVEGGLYWNADDNRLLVYDSELIDLFPRGTVSFYSGPHTQNCDYPNDCVLDLGDGDFVQGAIIVLKGYSGAPTTARLFGWLGSAGEAGCVVVGSGDSNDPTHELCPAGGAGGGGATEIPYLDAEGDELDSEAGFEYDPATNELTVDGVTISSAGVDVPAHANDGGVISIKEGVEEGSDEWGLKISDSLGVVPYTCTIDPTTGRIPDTCVGDGVDSGSGAETNDLEDSMTDVEQYELVLGDSTGIGIYTTINALTEEESPDAGDFLLCTDDDNSNELRKCDVGDLPAGSEVNDIETDGMDGILVDEIIWGTGNDAAAYGKISTLPEETSPAAGDWLLCEDEGGVLNKCDVGDITFELNTTEDSTGSTSNLSGLEITATGGLALLQGCTDGWVMKWEETGGLWECAADAGGAEVNNLETTVPPNADDTEVFIGTSASTGAWSALSGDAAMTNGGVVTISDLTIASEAQGDILYFNGTNWVRLGYGTSGHFLQTQGVSANPLWAASAGSGDVTAVGNCGGDECFNGGADEGSSLEWYNVLGNAVTAWGGTYFDFNVGVTGSSFTADDSDGDNGATFDDNSSEPDAPAATKVLLFQLADGELYKKDNGDGLNEQLMLNAGNVTGDVSFTGGASTVTDLTIASEAQGDVLFFNGTNWVRLGYGTDGHFLKTQGVSANPIWAVGGTAGADSIGTDELDDATDDPGLGDWVQVDPASTSRFNYRTDAELLSDTGAATLDNPTFTGTVTIPSPFTLGATSVTADGTELNLLDGITTLEGDNTGDDDVPESGDFTNLTGGDGITNTAGTLAVGLNTTEDSTGSTSNLSGLEITAAGELALLQGCDDEWVMKWEETGGLWTCAADAGAAGGDSVKIDGVAAADPDFTSDGDLDAIRCTGAGAPDASCVALEDVIYRVNTDSVALGDDTTGNYLGGVTTVGGLYLVGTEGANVGMSICGPGEIMKIVDDDPDYWDCSADGVGSTASSTDTFTNKSLDGDGTGNAIMVPDGAAGIASATENIAIDDSNEGQLSLYDGGSTAVRYINVEEPICRTLESAVVGDDDVPWGHFRRPRKILSYGCCDTDGAATATVALEDHAGNLINTFISCSACSSTMTFTDVSADADGTLAAGEGLRIDVGTAIADGEWLEICYTERVTVQ